MAKGLELRMENLIGFQSKDDFFVVEYDKILTEIREKIKVGWVPEELARSDYVKRIEELTFKRFGTRIKLFTSSLDAACIPFFVNDNNMLIKEAFREEGGDWMLSDKEVFEKPGSYNSGIDIKGAKIFGDYQKGISSFYMNYNVLMPSTLKGGYGLTNREIIAIHLHEQGHIFYPLLYSQEVDKTNAILEDARKELLGKKADSRTVLIKTFEKLGVSNKEQLVDGLTSSNPIVFNKAMVKLIAEETLQHNTGGKYTNTNFEALADNFAVRFGFGEELVTSLEKLVRGGVRWNSAISMFHLYLSTLAKVGKIIRLIFKANGELATAGQGGGLSKLNGIFFFLHIFEIIATAISLVIFSYYMVITAGESGRNFTYDDLVVRYTRIRSQLIEVIKRKGLTKSDAATVLTSLELMSKLIKKGQNWRGPLDFFFNTFNPEDRRAKDSIERQQALELLVNNDLFWASLKLQKLS